MNHSAWRAWRDHAWRHLVAGRRVAVPFELPHPTLAGFRQESIAEPCGQLRDWVIPVTDGSRIHLHEFTGGVLVAHRDKIDPNRGPVEALTHWVTEAPSGQLAVGCGLVYLLWRFT